MNAFRFIAVFNFLAAGLNVGVVLFGDPFWLTYVAIALPIAVGLWIWE